MQSRDAHARARVQCAATGSPEHLGLGTLEEYITRARSGALAGASGSSGEVASPSAATAAAGEAAPLEAPRAAPANERPDYVAPEVGARDAAAVCPSEPNLNRSGRIPPPICATAAHAGEPARTAAPPSRAIHGDAGGRQPQRLPDRLQGGWTWGRGDRATALTALHGARCLRSATATPGTDDHTDALWHQPHAGPRGRGRPSCHYRSGTTCSGGWGPGVTGSRSARSYGASRLPTCPPSSKDRRRPRTSHAACSRS